MSTGAKASQAAAAWLIESNRAAPTTHGTVRPRRGDGATSFRVIIATSLFLVLFSGALMVGGRAAIAPILRSAAAARDANSVGAIVVTMPGGKFCRHMSFDNTTAEIAESTVEACGDNIGRLKPRSSRGFAWGEQYTGGQ